jgi:hypothetical protein
MKVTGASSYGGNMALTLNQNGYTNYTITNSTNGTSSFVELAINSNSTSGGISLGKYATSKTAFKIISPNDGYLINSTAGDIALINNVASGNIKFAAGGSSTAHMTLHNTGNLLLGSTTNSGERLQVTGNVKIVGSGNTSSTTALLVENSDGSDLFTILNNGYTRYGNAGGSSFRVYPSSVAGNGDVDLSGQFLTLNSRSGTTETGNAGFVHINGVSASATSGIQNVLSIQKGFAPTSGTGIHNTLIFNPIINQTGGANGITRGLYVNPTLTAAADFRAIEWSNNSGWGLYGAGTANNYLGGNLLLGSTTNSGERLQVTGSTKLQGNVSTGANVTVGEATSNSGDLRFFNGNVGVRRTAASGLDFRTGSSNVGLTIDSTQLIALGGSHAPTAKSDIAASTTSNSSLRIRSGTAPTTPNDGDIWYDGTNIYMRVGATTKTFTLL